MMDAKITDNPGTRFVNAGFNLPLGAARQNAELVFADYTYSTTLETTTSLACPNPNAPAQLGMW